MSLKRGIDKAVIALVARIGELAMRSKIARRSHRLPPSPPTVTAPIGDIIADAMDKVGKDGTITVEEAKTIETTLDVVEGMQFDKGYLSPYFVTNQEAMEAIRKTPDSHPREEDQQPQGPAAIAAERCQAGQAIPDHR